MNINYVKFKKPTKIGSFADGSFYWGEPDNEYNLGGELPDSYQYNKWVWIGDNPNLEFKRVVEGETYDYLTGIDWYFLEQKQSQKLPHCKCKTIVIEHWGEDIFSYNDGKTLLPKEALAEQLVKFDNIEYDEIILISPLIDINFDLPPKVRIYLEPLAGPRFFCHKNNQMFWYNKQFFGGEFGAEWNTDTKNKLFHSMFFALRPHRKKVLNILHQDELLSNNGYFLGKDIPNTKVFETSDEYSDNTEYPLVLDKKIKYAAGRFAVSDVFAKQTYIELVVESLIYNGCTFMTEKVAKPFLGLQIPLFVSWIGYVEHLREQGFDMFDDIINHSYDNEVDENKRIDLVIKELKKLCKLDVPKLYSELKPRLLKNQKLFFDLIYENDRNPKLWKFIFGDRV